MVRIASLCDFVALKKCPRAYVFYTASGRQPSQLRPLLSSDNTIRMSSSSSLHLVVVHCICISQSDPGVLSILRIPTTASPTKARTRDQVFDFH